MKGLLLVNVGSPEAPEPAAVRRFLRAFLDDPRVIDLPAPLRRFLLWGVILPFRAPRSARAWASAWSPEGSPLVVHARRLREAVARELGDDWAVEVGMRASRPTIPEGLDALAARGCDRIAVLPLFPQYASSTTGSAAAEVFRWAGARAVVPALGLAPPFHHREGFLEAAAEQARAAWAGDPPDHVLFSFHGLPLSHVRAVDPGCLEAPGCCDRPPPGCYPAQCRRTARDLARRLQLPEGAWSLAWQSRLGRGRWLGPATSERVVALAREGVGHLAVLAPSFAADCLETLEELGIRAREAFLAAGGRRFTLAPCVNAHPRWVAEVARIARDALPA